jgi:coenzyme F420-reducing hydrogenase beta subunit
MCVGCGACLVADPSLHMEFNRTTMVYEPSGCGNADAAAVCPALRVDYDDLHARRFPGQAVTEHGVVHSVYLAQNTDRERNLRASSGGLVKELLAAYLGDDTVHGAIALVHRQGLVFEPALLRQGDDLDALPGSIYHNLPSGKVFELLRAAAGPVVVVAIPCQLEGILMALYRHAPALVAKVHAVVGLSCGWYYNHHALRAICRFKGLPFERVSSVSYRGGGAIGKLRISTDGRTQAINRRVDFDYQVAFDRSFNIPRCHVCVNHVNYFADIVVADAWLPSTVMTKTGISLLICRTAAADAVVQQMRDEGRIRLAEASVEDIAESQKSRNAFGDFAYAYMDYLRSEGLFCPDLPGPNRAAAKPAPRRAVAAFHRRFMLKRKLQQQGRYRALWWRKATIEFPRFAARYFRWFAVRILRIKSLTGQRKEISRAQLHDFA